MPTGSTASAATSAAAASAAKAAPSQVDAIALRRYTESEQVREAANRDNVVAAVLQALKQRWFVSVTSMSTTLSSLGFGDVDRARLALELQWQLNCVLDDVLVFQWSTVGGIVDSVVRSITESALSKGIKVTPPPGEGVCFLFPGQGAQAVGMAEGFERVSEARALFDVASKVLGYDLLKVCQQGPKSELDRTAVSQPAIFVTSMATIEVLRKQQPRLVASAVGAAGLSLGEYTALCFAGAISFEDALRLVKARGEAMEAAAKQHRGAMLSVLGLSEKQVSEVVRSVGGSLRVCNKLCPGNIVVGGLEDDVEKAIPVAAAAGATKTVRLAVAGAFHTPLMSGALDGLGGALAHTTFMLPDLRVFSNVDASEYKAAEDVPSRLLRQLTNTVEWQRCAVAMVEATQSKRVVEVGPGAVLSGLMRYINRELPEATRVEITSIPARYTPA